MPAPQPRPSRRRLAWVIAGTAALGLGLGLNAAWPPSGDAPAPQPQPRAAAPAQAETPPQAAARATAPPPPGRPLASADAGTPTRPLPAPAALPPPRPADLDPATWNALVRAAGGNLVELERMAAHLRWTALGARLRAAAPGSVEQRELAQGLAAGLDERLARRELHAGEALAWKRTLLAVLEPDPARREAALQAWIARQPGGSFTEPQADPRQARFEQLQAQLLTRHAGRGDPQALAAELDALRAQVFGPGASAPGGR